MKDINKKVIIDFGANKGQNIDYYLLKADIVVCVEANPELAKVIRKKFSAHIRNNKLFIENVVVTKSGNNGKLVNFYINKNDVLSSNIKPKNSKDFHLVKVQSKSISEILKKYLTKNKIFYYAKFDLEGYDAVVINSMLLGGYFPKNISTEVHTLESLEAIFDSGKYIGYKLQEGNKVSQYVSLPIKTKNKIKAIKFLAHSAGPMGEDIPGPWLTERSIRNKLRVEGLGWKDVHATLIPDSDPINIKHSELFLAGIKRLPRLIYQALLPYSLRDHPKFKKVISARMNLIENSSNKH
jgi:FkbM family methyltransferase